jgi:DtxR family Mn-dependent transcriptional regulator
VVKLVEMRPGQRGSIAYLNAQDQTRLNKLLAMGILPGAELELKRRSPSFVFQVGYSQFAVDENVASAVFVRLES